MIWNCVAKWKWKEKADKQHIGLGATRISVFPILVQNIFNCFSARLFWLIRFLNSEYLALFFSKRVALFTFFFPSLSNVKKRNVNGWSLITGRTVMCDWLLLMQIALPSPILVCFLRWWYMLRYVLLDDNICQSNACTVLISGFVLLASSDDSMFITCNVYCMSNISYAYRWLQLIFGFIVYVYLFRIYLRYRNTMKVLP